MKKADIIVLSGQSNAVGVGHVECLPLHFDEQKIKKWYDGYDNIKINYFSHDKKSGGFVKTTVGCTEVTKFTIGPELGIADALDLKYPGKEFFIIKCAFGGMSMHCDFRSPSSGSPYDRDAYADQKENIIENYGIGAPIRAGWCYNELVKIIRESTVYLKENGYEPHIRAFCWMQGESDAGTQEHADQYIGLYENMLSDLRSEFPEYFKDCVYIDAGISKTWIYHEKINEEKIRFAAAHENCVYLDTIGAGLTTGIEPYDLPDIYHYGSDCVIKLGHMFAEHVRPYSES